MKRLNVPSIIVMAALCLTIKGWAGNVPTAKKAADLANNHSASNGQYLVVRLEGTQTDSDLRPRQWDVTIYDSKRSNHGTVVRIKDGVLVSEAGAIRIIDDAQMSKFERNFTGYDPSEILDATRWKIDSTEALAKVLALPAITNAQVTDVKMTLRKLSAGEVGAMWEVKVKARSQVSPSQEIWIGSVDFSAESGEIIQSDLQPEKLKKKTFLGF